MEVRIMMLLIKSIFLAYAKSFMFDETFFNIKIVFLKECIML